VSVADLPIVNACLNAAATVLLSCGWVAIRRGRVRIHRGLMVAALAVSAAFLACYLTYHFKHGARSSGLGLTPFGVFYFAVLISHTILAILNLPMILVTVWLAARGRFQRHRAWARWTMPIWLYVSATGVLVYVLLYQVVPRLR